jgi:hypothetical protein
MDELSRYIFLMGAVPFIVLGSVHALHTPLRADQEKALSPRDPAYRKNMMQETPFLSRRLNLWVGWVSINWSHSLGIVVFGVTVLLAGRSGAAFEANGAWRLLHRILDAAPDRISHRRLSAPS